MLARVYAAPRPKWETLKNRRLQSWGGLVGKFGLVSDGPLPNVSFKCLLGLYVVVLMTLKKVNILSIATNNLFLVA